MKRLILVTLIIFILTSFTTLFVYADTYGIDVDIDIKRDAIAIENLREYTEKENSLLFSNPQVASEWNYDKNGDLKPEHFTANSNKKVWWKCQNGHEWQATINNRSNGRGCPKCYKERKSKG